MKDHHRMRAWDGETLWPFARYTLDGKKVEVSKQENGLNNKFIDSDKCEVELCSGLPDKNGTLIFEGDKYQNCSTMSFVVDRFTIAHWLDDEDRINFSSDRIEIVGNIHEVK